jgi:hypothetical protein
MKNFKRSEQQQKTLEGVELVYIRLIEFKKRINSELVVMKDNQIVRLKP